MDEKIIGISKDDILTQIKAEHKMSLDYVRVKREDFRTRLKLYNNQRKQRDKIGILTLYTTINTLLAVYYTDVMGVEFSGRERGDSYLANNINNTARFDHDEMGMDEINYQAQWDRLFYGVGLRDISTFNTTTNTPIALSKDPLSWLPDPRGGFDPKSGIGGFRFYGFEIERNKAEMESMGFDNVDEVIAAENSEAEQTKRSRNQAYGLDTQQQEKTGNYEGKDYAQIDWYTMLPNEQGGISKYLVTVDPGISTILRIEKVDPVTDEEKENEALVPWPLALNYYSPQRNNPFGTSVCDLVEDKQRAKSILANLRINKEKAALYPMYLYNTAKIKNRRDLDFGFNKAIGVNVGKEGSLNNVAVPLQKDQNSASTLNQEQSLESEVQISTGADQMQAGVLSEQNRTLGEVRQVTTNAQTRYLLGMRINAWGEKKFWFLWYRLYRQFFSKTQKKIVRLQGGMGVRYFTITRKDFITVQDPDIRIESKIELDSKRQERRLSLTQLAPFILQDPAKPAASKNFFQRELLRMNNVSEDMIEILIPDTPDEVDAKLENEILSRNEYVEIAMDEDHLSHMVIHAAAEDTTAKFAHIDAHRTAYKESGQMERDRAASMQLMAQNMAGAANTATAQISNKANNFTNGAQPAPITA